MIQADYLVSLLVIHIYHWIKFGGQTASVKSVINTVFLTD